MSSRTCAVDRLASKATISASCSGVGNDVAWAWPRVAWPACCTSASCSAAVFSPACIGASKARVFSRPSHITPVRKARLVDGSGRRNSDSSLALA